MCSSGSLFIICYSTSSNVRVMPLHNIIAIMYLRQIFLFKDYSKENHIGILQVYKFIEIIILTDDNE